MANEKFALVFSAAALVFSVAVAGVVADIHCENKKIEKLRSASPEQQFDSFTRQFASLVCTDAGTGNKYYRGRHDITAETMGNSIKSGECHLVPYIL